MLRVRLILCLLVTVSFFSCIGRQAYYVSPFNGLNSPYHSVPMRADSVKSASYFNGSMYIGGANEGDTDPKFSISTDLSRGHKFGMFQAYYAGGLTLGSYGIKPYESVGNNSSVNYSIINQNKGNYFFGGAGFDGGINVVTGSEEFEWKILGMETSLRQEFGKFAKVRKQIPDSAATVVIRDKFFGTLGLFTEFIGKGRVAATGCKIGWGKVLGRGYNGLNIKDGYFVDRPIRFGYFVLNVHTTRERWTYYLHGNLSKKASGLMFGMNYRISK